MAKTVAVLLYAAVAFGVLGLLVYWEVHWRTPEARRARLQGTILKHCRRMEKAKDKLGVMPLSSAKVPSVRRQ